MREKINIPTAETTYSKDAEHSKGARLLFGGLGSRALAALADRGDKMMDRLVDRSVAKQKRNPDKEQLVAELTEALPKIKDLSPMPLESPHLARDGIRQQADDDSPYLHSGAPVASVVSEESSITWNSRKAVENWEKGESDDGRLANTVSLYFPEEEADEVTRWLIRRIEAAGLNASLTDYDHIHKHSAYYKEKGITDVPRMVLSVSDSDRERLRMLVENYNALHNNNSLNARFSYK